MLQSLNFRQKATTENSKHQRSEKKSKSIIFKEITFKEFSHEINLTKLKEEKFSLTQQKIKSEFANTLVSSVKQHFTEKDINHQYIKLFDEIHSTNEMKRMQLQNQFVIEAENITVQQIKFHNIMGLMTERNKSVMSQRLKTGKMTGEMIPLIRAKSQQQNKQDYQIEKNQLRLDKLEQSYNMITSLVENNMQISLQLSQQIKWLKSCINKGHSNHFQIRTSISQILKKEGKFKNIMDDIQKKLISQKFTQEQILQIYEEENKSILIQQFENDVKQPFDNYTIERIQRDHIQPIYEDQNFQINDKNAQELILRDKIDTQKEVGLKMLEFLKIRKSFQNLILDYDWKEQYNFDSKNFKRSGMNFFRLAIIKILSKQSDQIIEDISNQYQQKEQQIDFTEHPVIQFYSIYPKGPKHLTNLLIKRYQHFSSQLLFKNKISGNLNQQIDEKQKEFRNLQQRQAEQNFIDQQSLLFEIDLGNLHYTQLQIKKQDQNDLNLLTEIRKLEEVNEKNDTFLVRIFYHLFENLSKFLQTIEMINNKVKSLISGKIQTVNIREHKSFIEMINEKLIVQVGKYKKSNKFDEKKLSVKITIFLDKMLDTNLFDENEQIALKNYIIGINNSGSFQGLFCIPTNYKEYFISIKKEMEEQTTIFQFIKDQAYANFEKIVQQFLLSFQEIIRSQMFLFRKQNILKTDRSDFLKNNYNFKLFRNTQQNIAQKIYLNSKTKQDSDIKLKSNLSINYRDRLKRNLNDNDEEFEELYLNKTYVTIRDNKKLSDFQDNQEIVEQIQKTSIRQNIDNLSDQQLRQYIIFEQGSSNQQILKTLNKQQTLLNEMTRRRSQNDTNRQQLKTSLNDFNRQIDKQDRQINLKQK